MCATEPNRVVSGQYNIAEDQGKQDSLLKDELLKRKVKPREHKLCKKVIKKKRKPNQTKTITTKTY